MDRVAVYGAVNSTQTSTLTIRKLCSIGHTSIYIYTNVEMLSSWWYIQHSVQKKTTLVHKKQEVDK